MKVTIQGVESRRKNIDKMLESVDAEVFIDTEMKGPFYSFSQMLNIPFDNYKLHLQDDVILPKNFSEYLDVVERDMELNGIDVLSLFAPRRKFLVEQNEKGVKYSIFPNFLWLQATVFSKDAVNGMLQYLPLSDEIKDDDYFVQQYLKHSKKKAYVHLPSIVQHNIYIKSEMGHANSPTRMSPIYDKEYISNYLNEKK